MSVTKTLISGTPIAGGTVRWQLVARNAGPSVATGVTVADVAPAGVAFTAVTTTAGTCTRRRRAAVHARHAGRSAATVTVTLTGTIDAGLRRARR